MKYSINSSSWFNEGGSCQFYPISENAGLGFKEFYTKTSAINARNIQQKLSRFDLAPKVYSPICRLKMINDDKSIFQISNWGYITEIAEYKHFSKKNLKQIQLLVDRIHKKTSLKFWDCHYDNLGLVKRNGRKKLVCIDTGKESFGRDANAWGNANPGPKCSYCKKFSCKCEY